MSSFRHRKSGHVEDDYRGVGLHVTYTFPMERVSQATWAGKLKIPIHNRTTHTMPLSRLRAE
jgi:hypothetical protein